MINTYHTDQTRVALDIIEAIVQVNKPKCRWCERAIIPFQGRWRHEGDSVWCYNDTDLPYIAEPQVQKLSQAVAS